VYFAHFGNTLLHGNAHSRAGPQKQIPFGNDRQKGKGNGKGRFLPGCRSRFLSGNDRQKTQGQWRSAAL